MFLSEAADVEENPFAALPAPMAAPSEEGAWDLSQPLPALGPLTASGPQDLAYAEGYADAPAVDPEYAAQLAAARAALDGRFAIVDERETDALPNEITAAVYEGLIRQYADIATGRSDIQFAEDLEDPEAFRAAAMGDIATIMQTQNGRDLLAALHQTADPDDPLAESRTTTIGLQTGALPITNPADFAHTNDGVGTDAGIGYLPGERFDDERSDVILFHELRHAWDVTRGTADCTPLGDRALIPADASIPAAEYPAIGVAGHEDSPMTENKYRAERRLIGASGVGALEDDLELEDREFACA